MPFVRFLFEATKGIPCRGLIIEPTLPVDMKLIEAAFAGKLENAKLLSRSDGALILVHKDCDLEEGSAVELYTDQVNAHAATLRAKPPGASLLDKAKKPKKAIDFRRRKPKKRPK